jgi:hypothetical protein
MRNGNDINYRPALAASGRITLGLRMSFPARKPGNQFALVARSTA